MFTFEYRMTHTQGETDWVRSGKTDTDRDETAKRAGNWTAVCLENGATRVEVRICEMKSQPGG